MVPSGSDPSEHAGHSLQGVDLRDRALAAATERMLLETRMMPGSRVLDVGSGTGETALLAASRVGASGHVVATDGSPAMTIALAAAVRSSAATNVTVRAMDLRNIDLPSNSFDAVIARNVLMFVPVPRAIVGLYRVLRPGGRLAAVVWSALANNPLQQIILDAARRLGGWGDSPPELARAFSSGDPNVYRRTLQGAGYHDVCVHLVAAVRRFTSATDAIDTIKSSPIQTEPIERLPERRRSQAWEQIETRLRAFERHGLCEIPLESLVVVGQK